MAPMAASWTRFKQTLSVRFLGWWKIPLIAAVRPRVEELDERRCVIRIPLRRRTRNHLGSMYFGALAIGADIAGGLIAVERIRRRKAQVSLVFKSFHAQFLKRPESDVYFICEEGPEIGELVDQALASEERVGRMVRLQAAVRAPDGSFDPVADLEIELTLKRSSRGAI
ncbi:MAG: DUF4442 domain-containing protein [Acidobacteria bacterium]|nr:DUF4442 domain-containing protein [Acidobacteriota bacterium]